MIKAVAQLKANDVLPVIATGRNIFEIKNVIQQTQIDTLVSANGAYIVLRGKPVDVTEIPKDVIKRLTALVKNHDDAYATLNNQTDRINRMIDNVKKSLSLHQ
ncbi:HAD hydrolase family protein [Secundilactobacillus silagei]|uniref:HAD hydrolase family protein n=1 Tax=Secundilactobacillus silagei TaxID=1293415 RepID=UPI000A50D398|nr:HAD hydrolase family protein [Secundilactobacillus silagei]